LLADALTSNSAYRATVNHPADFGKPAKQVWATLWKYLEPLVQQCISKGQPTYHKNDLIFYRLNDRGRYIEQYHTWTMVPIVDHDAIVGGYSMCLDTTHEVLAERRSQTTRTLADELAFARSSMHTTTRWLTRSTPTRRRALAICYQVDEQGQTDALTWWVSRSRRPSASHAHRCAPEQMTLEMPRWRRRPSADKLEQQPPSRSASRRPPSSHPATRRSSRLQSALIGGVAHCQGSLHAPVHHCRQLCQPHQGSRSASGTICPTRPSSSPSWRHVNAIPPAVLILGLNRHSPLDNISRLGAHHARVPRQRAHVDQHV
jgi:hypothetical protein